MHGRPRKAATQEEQEASGIKASKLRSLQSQFLQLHHNKVYSIEALEVSAKLLEANPEYYTAWNYRKLAVEHRLGQLETPIDSDAAKSIRDEELRLVESALKKNYKSYGAWHHRKWVLNNGHSSSDRELWLLGKFQKADARNFHAWNYRRFVTALKNIPDEEELKYTTDMIYDNFSNYSAWHNRSVLLSRLLKEKVTGYFPKEDVLTEEYEFVRHALFTDPDDQSGWFYHLWLLDQTIKLGTLSFSSWPPNGSSICVPTKRFPIILFFSEMVEGVNSSTVTVECDSDLQRDVVWKPLSLNEIECARAWLTYLSFPSEEFHSSKACQIKVNLAHSQGIIASSGVYYSNSSHITSTVCVIPSSSESAGEQNFEKFSWKEENFCQLESQFQESLLLNLFSQVRVHEDDSSKGVEWNIKMVTDEITHCRELLSAMDCKIGKLTLARLLMARDALMSYNGSHDQSLDCYREVLELYNDLTKIDQTHCQYYKDEHSLVLLKQLASNMECLLKHCCQYRDATTPSIGSSIGLRLNNLSLSRIGCIEQLLWVQILDLSHNQLCSIEGLEAMQLLSCLNLSNNQLRCFTVLEPLRKIKPLRVLDISYNEIGGHTIDTRRYLCSSPLSHGNDWNTEKLAVSDIELTNYWDAYLVFRDLNLIQLDVAGNPVIDETLKGFFFKLLPALQWLDGEKLQ